MSSAATGQGGVTSLAVIDEHDVVHAGVAAWCADVEPPVALAKSFSSVDSFLDDCDPSIDLVVLEIRRNRKVEFAALRALCERGWRVVVYTDVETDEILLTCLDIGAMTYVLKSEDKRHLIEAIQQTVAGIPHTGPRMARAIRNDSLLGRINLSEREREVLIAWFQTESKDAVGKQLFIAPTTVRTHLQRARAKYASVGRPAPTKSALLARAIEDGLLALEDL